MIVERAPADTLSTFAHDLKRALNASKIAATVVIFRAPVPLGKPDLPAEAHPYCVPEAPGKDRMDIPPPAPWDSPLGAMCICEILRARCLAEARAVANIDVHDLVPKQGDATIFDNAVAAQGGLIALIGRHCYPWRVRNGQDARFGDHICIQFDARGGRQRWCLAPAKTPIDAIWRLVRIGNAQPDRTRTQAFFRHMVLRHPLQSISKRSCPKPRSLSMSRSSTCPQHTGNTTQFGCPNWN